MLHALDEIERNEAGKVMKERSLPTEPELISAWLGKTGLTFERVGHEAGPMSSWPDEELSKLGLAVVCVEARHMQRFRLSSTMREKPKRAFISFTTASHQRKSLSSLAR